MTNPRFPCDACAVVVLYRRFQVNEELVKNAVAVGGSGVSAAAIKKTAKTKRTTKASKAAAIRRNGKGRPASASLESHPQPPPPQPPPPPPPPSRHGGHVDSAEFNVGTYTAKRAKTRARQGARCVRRVDDPAILYFF